MPLTWPQQPNHNAVAITAALLALGFVLYAIGALPLACAAALPALALLLAIGPASSVL